MKIIKGVKYQTHNYYSTKEAALEASKWLTGKETLIRKIPEGTYEYRRGAYILLVKD